MGKRLERLLCPLALLRCLTTFRCTTWFGSILLLGVWFCVTSHSTFAQNNPRLVTNGGAGVDSRLNSQNSQQYADQQGPLQLPTGLNVDQMLSPGGLTSTLKIMLLLTILSLAPSILIMTTCFIRLIIVLGLLRQALGTQQLPPNQVIVSLCLFLTFLVMAPVWQEAYHEGLKPYTDGRHQNMQRAFDDTVRPLRNFMSNQIEKTGNSDAVWMFLNFQNSESNSTAERIFQDPENPEYDEVPLSVLLPAYMMSELKIAFLIGFQLYLPFLVIDMVVSSVLISMGMMMLPPVLISLPFKLLLFVMIDGWYLTVEMLLESVRPFG